MSEDFRIVTKKTVLPTPEEVRKTRQDILEPECERLRLDVVASLKLGRLSVDISKCSPDVLKIVQNELEAKGWKVTRESDCRGDESCWSLSPRQDTILPNEQYGT